jgi:hypothetical protein
MYKAACKEEGVQIIGRKVQKDRRNRGKKDVKNGSYIVTMLMK